MTDLDLELLKGIHTSLCFHVRFEYRHHLLRVLDGRPE